MPLYVGDYLADTAHLRTIEHGAYLLLIMHYWRTGGLPDDDGSLARIARMRLTEWHRVRPVIEAFFQPGWKHKRIELEFSNAFRISMAGKRGGEASGLARKGKNINKSMTKSNDRSQIVERSLNDRATIGQPLHSHSPKKERKKEKIASAAALAAAADAAREPDFVEAIEPVDEDPKAKLFRVGKTILISFGIAEKRTGALIGQWLKAKNDPVGLLAAIQYARDQNVAEPIAYITTLISSVKARNGQFGKQSLSDRAFQLADEFEAAERARGIERPPDRH
jgi:uncharacterized protein YdaU (DUF1376 family)